MHDSRFQFTNSSSGNALLELDFTEKTVHFFKNAFGHESSGSPDSTCKFSHLLEDESLQQEINNEFGRISLDQIKQLCAYSSTTDFKPRGEFIHLFKSKKEFSKQKNLNLLVAGVIFCILFLVLFFGIKNQEIVERLSYIFGIVGFALILFFGIRIQKKGGLFCMTSDALYILKKTTVLYFPWTIFKDEFIQYDKGRSLHCKTKQESIVYTGTIARKAPVYIEFNEIEQVEFIQKIIAYRLTQLGERA